MARPGSSCLSVNTSGLSFLTPCTNIWKNSTLLKEDRKRTTKMLQKNEETKEFRVSFRGQMKPTPRPDWSQLIFVMGHSRLYREFPSREWSRMVFFATEARHQMFSFRSRREKEAKFCDQANGPMISHGRLKEDWNWSVRSSTPFWSSK